MEVTLQDIPVMYVISADNSKSITQSFAKLENAIGWQLKGRTFYGTLFNGEYRASLAFTDPTEPDRLGFPTWTIPGGKYKREKINDWIHHTEEIAPKMKDMKQNNEYDDSRPCVEFYRSMKELFLLVPIK